MSDRRKFLLRRIAERRQELLDRREAGILARVDRAIREVWNGVFSALTRGGPTAVDAARKAVAALPDRLTLLIGDALSGLHHFAFTGTSKDIVEKLTEKDRSNLVLSAINRGLITPTSSSAPLPFSVPTLSETIGVVFKPMPRSQVDAIVYAGNWRERVAKITKLADPEKVAEAVARSYSQGKPPQSLAKELRPILQNVQSSVRRVVRTEGARVSQTARMQAYDGLGDLVIGYQIHAVRDSRTRPEHAKRDGYQYFKNPKPGQRGYDQMPRPPLEADGSPAFNCLLPGTCIEGRFLKGWKAHYAGQAVELVCSDGSSIRVTPGHPVLTSKGFVPAGNVSKLDQLVSYPNPVGILAASKNKGDCPSRVEDVFSSIEKLSGIIARRPAFAEEFHGDAIWYKSDVDVVFAHGKLRNGFNSSCDQELAKPFLVGRGMDLGCLPSSRPFHLNGKSIFHAPSGSMSRHDLVSSLSSVLDPTPFGFFGLRLVSNMDAHFDKSFPNRVPADSKVFRDLILRHPAFVSDGNLSARDFLSPRQDIRVATTPDRDSVICDPAGDRLAFYANLAADFSGGLTSKVILNQVVEVRRFFHDGPVYDFETETGTMLAGNESINRPFWISNCRCWLTPILRPPIEMTMPATVATAGL